jgi:glycosyltransferase involved in cell wall biosynthesis
MPSGSTATPRVSVVIPTHNHALFLPRAIEGVVAQSFPSWDLVVVDDGSTDDTPAVMAGLADGERIRYLRQARRERAAARNAGGRASRGEFVAFLDADDWWAPEKLGRQVALLDATPEACLCHTDCWVVAADGSRTRRRLPPRDSRPAFEALLCGNPIVCSTAVVRRECLDAVGWFDESLTTCGAEDWDVWLRLARRSAIAYLDEPLVYYRQHSYNTSLLAVFESYRLVLDKSFADPGLPGGAQRLRPRAYARYHANMALALARLGESRACRARLLAAFRLSPAILRHLGLLWLFLRPSGRSRSAVQVRDAPPT